MSDINTYRVRYAKGTTWRFAFTWKQKDQAGVITAKDLTGYGAELSIRKRGAASPMVTLSTTAGTIVLGGAAGTVVATLSATASEALELGDALWSIEFNAPNGDVYEKLRGQFYVEEEITQ